ncbi:hypothetical protein Ancab_028494 [Ancistrocladus abbreviatus]
MIKTDPGLSRKWEAAVSRRHMLLCRTFTHSLEAKAVAVQGPQAFHDVVVEEKLIDDVKEGRGILTIEYLRHYKLHCTQLVGVGGGSRSLCIIPVAVHVFLNNFVLLMETLAAVQNRKGLPQGDSNPFNIQERYSIN